LACGQASDREPAGDHPQEDQYGDRDTHHLVPDVRIGQVRDDLWCADAEGEAAEQLKPDPP